LEEQGLLAQMLIVLGMDLAVVAKEMAMEDKEETEMEWDLEVVMVGEVAMVVVEGMVEEVEMEEEVELVELVE